MASLVEEELIITVAAIKAITESLNFSTILIAMAIRDLIDDLNHKLTSTTLGVNAYSTIDLQDSISKILRAIIVDYETYSSSISKVIRALEWNKDLSRTILINNFLSLYNSILDLEFEKFNEDVLTTDFEENIAAKWAGNLEKSMYNNIQVRVSSFQYNTDGLEEIEKRQIVSMIRGVIQRRSTNMTWDNEVVNEVLLQLATARSLLDEVGESGHFYFLAGNVLDRYYTSQLHQNARDLAEELVFTSFRQGLPHWGFFMYFKCYSNSSSAISALVYGNMSMESALEFRGRLNTHYAKEIIWESIKFFRNIGIGDLVETIFKSIPKDLLLDKYSIRSITHSYFSHLMAGKDPKLPALVLDFLDENREEILGYAEAEIIPWLLTLFNIEVLYFNSNFKHHPLYQYVKIFEMIAPIDHYASRKHIIYKDLLPLKIAMKEALLRLKDTRYASDFVNDNNHALLIASKIIGPAINANDPEALLLAMIIKTDYTYVFIEQSRQELSEVKIADLDIELFEKTYWNFDEIKNLLKSDNIEFYWIINTENSYYNLTLYKNTFKSNELKDWKHSQLVSLFRSKYFSKFKFDKTAKRHDQIVQLFPEDHLRESHQLSEHFDFLKIDSLETDPLYVIMDMNVSEFPHNLFFDLNGNFIYLNRSVSNIISTEWYLSNSNKVKLSGQFTKSIWIPTEGGDLSIIRLFQNLEDTLLAENFNTLQNLNIVAPISSEINIIVSHGADDIAINQAIYPDVNPRVNMSQIGKFGEIDHLNTV